MRVLMYWVDPKDHMLKVLCQYIYYWLRYRVNQEKRPIVNKPINPKLTQIPRVSSLMFLMYWIDPKDHMLKVLCQYLNYWLKYSR